MCRLDFIIAVVLVPCYMISSAEIPSSSEESTQGHFENYDSQNSEEFDPMKQTYNTYEDFITAGSRQNSLTEMLRASTRVRPSPVDEEITTVDMDAEPTTIKPEDATNYAASSVNDINSSLDDPSAQRLTDISNGSGLLSIKPKMYETQPDEHHEHVAKLHSENNDEEIAIVAIDNRNDTEEVHDEPDTAAVAEPDRDDDSAPRTIPPYFDTTTELVYLHSAPVFPTTSTTNVPTITSATQLPTTTRMSSMATTTTVTPIPTTPTTVSTTHGKKSKKIDTPTHLFKYSADEILRKYLEDIHIRAPLAALINTSPATLRKAKMLWKSTLRPNSQIDIVLVAFNSSGKENHNLNALKE